jgi:protein required for attachment to host cells
MLSQKTRTWVLTADRAKAKTFEWLPKTNFLKEISSFEESDVRKHERDLKADRPGHGNNPSSRYSVEDKSSYKQQASQNFLKDVAELLCKKEALSAYDKLVVIAQKEVYQTIRDNLTPIAQNKITLHHAKDLTYMPQQELSDYYNKHMK